MGFKVLTMVDEATEKIISGARRQQAVEVDEDIQAMNIVVEQLYKDPEEGLYAQLKVRLCYRYRKKLGITLLGTTLKVKLDLKNTSKVSLRSLLQRKLNNICNSNYVIGIDMFFVNIIELMQGCKWITEVNQNNYICTLYNM
uniref:U1 protein n=1 Tax=Sophora yellow stunt virus TaxID=1980160 RepID=A0A1W5YSG3_9VIRU|nr:U1 protein [Sophora yellow stunt virus]WGT79565.1 U1 protein [Sophora yellow stunt virus]